MKEFCSLTEYFASSKPRKTLYTFDRILSDITDIAIRQASGEMKQRILK